MSELVRQDVVILVGFNFALQHSLSFIHIRNSLSLTIKSSDRCMPG